MSDGFLHGAGGNDVSDTTATAPDVLPGKEFYNAAGDKVEGTMPTKAAATLTPSSSVDTIITAGQYLTGDQSLLKDGDFQTYNIKTGKNLWGKVGTYTSDATAYASDILAGKTAYARGNKYTGSYTPPAEKKIHHYRVVDFESADKLSGTIEVVEGFTPYMIQGHCNNHAEWYSNAGDYAIIMFIFCNNGVQPNLFPIVSGEVDMECVWNDPDNAETATDGQILEATTLTVVGTTLTYEFNPMYQYKIIDSGQYEINFFGIA